MKRTYKYKTAANAEKGKTHWINYWQERGYHIISAEYAAISIKNTLKKLTGVDKSNRIWIVQIHAEQYNAITCTCCNNSYILDISNIIERDDINCKVCGALITVYCDYMNEVCTIAECSILNCDICDSAFYNNSCANTNCKNFRRNSND